MDLIKILEQAKQEVPNDLIKLSKKENIIQRDRYGVYKPLNFQHHLRSKNQYREPIRRKHDYN